MITPAEVNLRYSNVEPYLAPLRRYVNDTLSPYCEDRGFALVSRVKTRESVSEKIESGRFASWAEIDDLVAFAVVIPTLAHEESVVAFLTERFRTVDIKRRGATPKAPDVFRFDSTRFIGTTQAPPGAEGGRPIDKLPFEVQVRSAFDHAWMVTTHDLVYKSPVADWRQRRLAAELKATTEKMDLLIMAFQEASEKIPSSPWPAIEAKSDIHRFFSEAAERDRIPAELLPKDWSRFTDNVYDLGRYCWRDAKPTDIARNISEAVDAELTALGAEKVPRGLSLWQITLCSLSKAGLLRAPRPGRYLVITREMEDLYPSLRDFQQRFQFDAT